MNVFWFFALAVVVCIGLLVWLERRDRRVLREHLRKRYPVRLTNSFWGALNPTEGAGAEPAAVDKPGDEDER